VNGHKIANQLKTVMEYATDPVEIKWWDTRQTVL
jgi:hypothetical protein